MVQPVKALVDKNDNQNPTPRTHMAEGENQQPEVGDYNMGG